MQSLWNDREAADLDNDPLKLRVYSSRLLGQETDLVLHGGGNTSVKATSTDLLGDTKEVLHIKGSGWDLATIKAPGFAPVKLNTLRRLARLEALSDTDMVAMQRAAMTDPKAPNPSIEAILHAIIPFKYVDHTHADAVVTITNTEGGETKIEEIYGDRVIVIPYIMPGFLLARTVEELTRDLDWNKTEGMILLNHGIFTFHDDPKESYNCMIRLVHAAEEYLRAQGAMTLAMATGTTPVDHPTLAKIRKQVSLKAGRPMIVRLDNSAEARGFADLDRVSAIATRGPITPDHVIHTKRIPWIIASGETAELDAYENAYQTYFEAHRTAGLICLDPAPRWAVWPGQGVVGFGKSHRDARIVTDIAAHTLRCIQYGEGLGGWKALPADRVFEIEYWELEQAKLQATETTDTPLAGKVALVTGAASGIGKACVDSLLAQGACVAGLDIDSKMEILSKAPTAKGLVCDVTDPDALRTAVEKTVRTYGGLDILISNAGLFPTSQLIEDSDLEVWHRCLNTNLTGAMNLMRHAIPYLRHGWEPAIVFIGSRNVPAPGPGAAAYSVSKAGLNQLARVAALELAADGIRVNTIHPDAVFDTALWPQAVIQGRAASYGLSVEAYKRKNLLETEISSRDVAAMACAMAGPIFAKTTGAQVPVDGGDNRVI